MAFVEELLRPDDDLASLLERSSNLRKVRSSCAVLVRNYAVHAVLCCAMLAISWRLWRVAAPTTPSLSA